MTDNLNEHNNIVQNKDYEFMTFRRNLYTMLAKYGILDQRETNAIMEEEGKDDEGKRGNEGLLGVGVREGKGREGREW